MAANSTWRVRGERHCAEDRPAVGSRVVRDDMRPATEGHSAKHRSTCHYWLTQRGSREMGYWFLMGISAKGHSGMSAVRKRAGA